jgi:hypothetical protein
MTSLINNFILTIYTIECSVEAIEMDVSSPNNLIVRNTNMTGIIHQVVLEVFQFTNTSSHTHL